MNSIAIISRLMQCLRNQWSCGLFAAAAAHGFVLALLAALSLGLDSGGDRIGLTVRFDQGLFDPQFMPEPMVEIAVIADQPREKLDAGNHSLQRRSNDALLAAREEELPLEIHVDDPTDRRAARIGVLQSLARESATGPIVAKQMMTADVSTWASAPPPVLGEHQLGSEQTPADFSGNLVARYPEEALRYGLQGTVLLRLFVSDQGTVEDVEIASSSGHAILDRSAVNMVRHWRGKPRTRGGEPITSIETIPIYFRL